MSRNMQGLVFVLAILGAARFGLGDDKPASGTAKPSPAPAAKDDKTAPPAHDGAAAASSMPDWTKLAAPNENHKRLSTLVGKWTVEVTAAAPGAQEPPKMTGTAEYASILEGRYLTEHVTCDLGGMPFEWHGCYGYDNAKKKFFAAWVDNMQTGLDLAEGDADAGVKVVTLCGEQSRMDGSKTKYAWIVTLPEKDQAQIEMRQVGADGKESTEMKFTLHRVP